MKITPSDEARILFYNQSFIPICTTFKPQWVAIDEKQRLMVFPSPPIYSYTHKTWLYLGDYGLTEGEVVALVDDFDGEPKKTIEKAKTYDLIQGR